MSATETPTMKIADIEIGERFRKEMGDLKELAASIESNGLLHPVVVRPDGELVAGQRRIEAARLLGWTDIRVTVVDVADLLAAERAENADRKAFTRSEAVAIGKMIEEQHRAKIATNKKAWSAKGTAVRDGKTTLGKSQSGDFPDPVGNTRDVASAAVGMDGQTYTKAKDIVAAAEENPERFGDLPAQMDETGNVGGTHRELERRRGPKPGKRKTRHPIHGRARHMNANKMIERAVNSLDGVCFAITSIEVEEADREQSKEWAASLKESAKNINAFARRLLNGK